VSNNNLLHNGWRNDDLLWQNIAPEAKDSIREFVSAISSYKLSNNDGPMKIEEWLTQSLTHFYDRRYNKAVPKFGLTPFWSFTNEFALVTNRLITKKYCNNGGVAVILSMQMAVSSALERHASILMHQGVTNVA
jgi:hypothetical protein